MHTWNMPPDTSAKEKIVGGIFDITQTIFILIGVAIGIVLGFLLRPIGGAIGFVIGLIPGLILGGVFALLKIHGLMLHQYLMYKKKHKLKTKKLPNVRIEALEKADVSKIKNY